MFIHTKTSSLPISTVSKIDSTLEKCRYRLSYFDTKRAHFLRLAFILCATVWCKCFQCDRQNTHATAAAATASVVLQESEMQCIIDFKLKIAYAAETFPPRKPINNAI